MIGFILAFCMFVPAYVLALRYNMHMFQLNGYKNGEHCEWVKKNFKQQWLIKTGAICGVVFCVFKNDWSFIAGIIILWMEFIVYRAMKRIYNKKKIVYTARMKRLIVTDVVLTILILFVFIKCLDVSSWNGVLLLLVGLQEVFDIIANVCNYPIEWIIKKYYIEDAKRIIKSMPNLTIIGVTGSYGKTSVKFYLQTLLQEKYSVLVTPESYNTPMGVVKTIREFLKPTHQIFICEMGARHVGDIKEICDIVHPMHGVITSIGPQHLETFFSIDNIKKTKFELADALPYEGMLFLNGDNDYIQNASEEYFNKVFYFSERNGEGYSAQNITVSQMGTEFDVLSPLGEQEHFKMRLIGSHNVINVVGAIAVANQMGIELNRLKAPVRRIQAVEHRMQLREHGDITIIDDAYNSNPVGSKAAVETLSLFDGVRILVTPGMVELGKQEDEYNYKFGTYAAECCDYIMLVGERHVQPIYEGIMSKGFPKEKCFVFHKFDEAMRYVYGIKEERHKFVLLENDLPDNY